MIYAGIIILLLTIFKFFFKRLGKKTAILVGFMSIVLVVVVNIYGYINSNYIHTTHYDIHINKKSNIDNLKLVMVADMHLGYNKGYNMVKNMVNKIIKYITSYYY